MAKRVRGSTSRPGQRRPLQRPAVRPQTRPAAPVASVATPTSAEPRSDELTEAEEARAAQLEAAIVAEERQAEASKRRARTARSVDAEAARPGSSLAISASEEYAYVARDVRRIAIVGGSLTAILLGLWALSHIAGVAIL
jgi:hypothetical protein